MKKRKPIFIPTVRKSAVITIEPAGAKDPVTVYCYVSGNPIPNDRVEALLSLGVPKELMTCIEHSQATKKKGIYMGEHGTSEMKIVRQVYNDSVRDIFRGANSDLKETADEDDDEEGLPPVRYIDIKTETTYRRIQDEEKE